jgi:hypothetical protein
MTSLQDASPTINLLASAQRSIDLNQKRASGSFVTGTRPEHRRSLKAPAHTGAFLLLSVHHRVSGRALISWGPKGAEFTGILAAQCCRDNPGHTPFALSRTCQRGAINVARCRSRKCLQGGFGVGARDWHGGAAKQTDADARRLVTVVQREMKRERQTAPLPDQIKKGR